MSLFLLFFFVSLKILVIMSNLVLFNLHIFLYLCIFFLLCLFFNLSSLLSLLVTLIGTHQTSSKSINPFLLFSSFAYSSFSISACHSFSLLSISSSIIFNFTFRDRKIVIFFLCSFLYLFPLSLSLSTLLLTCLVQGTRR